MRAVQRKALQPMDYLALERGAVARSEYLDGEIFAMAGASREHNQIVSNLVAGLGQRLRERPCGVYASDLKVWIDAARHYTYPDLVIACDPERFQDEQRDVLLNPKVLIEVISPSSEAYDRGLKFRNYQTLGTMVEYLLVSQTERRVERFERQPDGRWLYSEAHGADGVLDVICLGVSLPLSEVYHRIQLEPDAP